MICEILYVKFLGELFELHAITHSFQGKHKRLRAKELYIVILVDNLGVSVIQAMT